MPLRMRFYRSVPGDLITQADIPIHGEVPPAKSVLLTLLVNRHMLQDDTGLKHMRADIADDDGVVRVETAVEIWQPAPRAPEPGIPYLP